MRALNSALFFRFALHENSGGLVKAAAFVGW
jgi:hypothetical protein